MPLTHTNDDFETFDLRMAIRLPLPLIVFDLRANFDTVLYVYVLYLGCALRKFGLVAKSPAVFIFAV